MKELISMNALLGTRLTGIILLILCLAACSNMNQAQYPTGAPRSTADLAVPPGLSAPELSSGAHPLLVTQPITEEYTLNQIKDMQIVQGGSERYLMIKGNTLNQIWPMLQAYLKQAGLSIKYQNKAIGLIQTDWTTKNNVVKEKDIRAFFDWIGWGSMYSLQSQFAFRLNLWQNETDTEIFVTVYQMNEVYPGCAKYLNQNIHVAASTNQAPIWMPMPPNPKLELEFLMKFMAFAGQKPQSQPVEPQLVASPASVTSHAATLQGSTLLINDSFDRAWWRIGLALERVGLGITDKNRSTGEYYVYPLQSQVDNPDPGFIDRWFGNDKNSLKIPKAVYTVKLTSTTQANVSLELSLYPGAQDKEFAVHQSKYLNELLKQME